MTLTFAHITPKCVVAYIVDPTLKFLATPLKSIDQIPFLSEMGRCNCQKSARERFKKHRHVAAVHSTCAPFDHQSSLLYFQHAFHSCLHGICLPDNIIMPSHHMFCQWNVYVANGCNLYGDGILANSSVTFISYRSVSRVASYYS